MRDTKEIECSNKCGVLTTVNLPKKSHSTGKRFLCGFCAAVGLQESEDQIKKLKLELTDEVAKLNKLFAEAKGSLDKLNNKISDAPTANGQIPPQSDRTLNIVVLGLSEKEEKDRGKRAEAESELITEALQDIGINDSMDSLISDYSRIGRFRGEDGRSRPIILHCTSIWNKRKLMSGFFQNRTDVTFRFKNDFPLTEERKNAISEARRKNEEEKVNAAEENREVTNSYSVNDNGTVVEYQLLHGRWSRAAEQANNTEA